MHDKVLPKLLLIPLFFGCGCGADKPEQPTLPPTATVAKDKAVFWFPTPNGKLIWGGRTDRKKQYAWMAHVELPSGAYMIGFAYFAKSETLEKGSLEQLLAQGQSNVWTANHGPDSAISAKVTTITDKGGIRIELNDPDILTQIRKDRPETIEFIAEGDSLKQETKSITVQYTD